MRARQLILALAVIGLSAASALADPLRVAVVQSRGAECEVLAEVRPQLSEGELRLGLERLDPVRRYTPSSYVQQSLRWPLTKGHLRARVEWAPPALVFGGLSPAEREPLVVSLRRSPAGVQVSASWMVVGTQRVAHGAPRGLLVLAESSPESRSELWVALALGFPADLEWEQIAAETLAGEDPRAGCFWLSAFPAQRAETRAALAALAERDPRARAPLLRLGAWPDPAGVEPPEGFAPAFWRQEAHADDPARVLVAAERVGPDELARRPRLVGRLDALAGTHPLPAWFRDRSRVRDWPEWDRGLGGRVLLCYLLPLLLLAGLARWENEGPERTQRAAYLLLLGGLLWLGVDLVYRDTFDLLPDSWGWGLGACGLLRLGRVRRARAPLLSRSLCACFALGAGAGIALEHSSAIGVTYERLAFLAAAGGLLGLAALWLLAAELWAAHERPTWALWSRAAAPLGLALGLGAMLAGRLDPSQLPPAFARALRWGPALVSSCLPLAALAGLSVLWRPLPAGFELAPKPSRGRLGLGLLVAGVSLALALAWGSSPGDPAGYALRASELPARAGAPPSGLAERREPCLANVPRGCEIQPTVDPSSDTTAPLPPADAEAGRVLNDRYEVIRRVGQGGMGAVYLVVDRQSGDQVAL